MSKSVKIILAVIITILILFGLIKWIILPMTIEKHFQDTVENLDSNSVGNADLNSVESADSNSVGNADLTSAEINAFNAKFEPYEGSREGSDIKSLVENGINE